MLFSIIRNFREFQRSKAFADVPNWQKQILAKVKPFTMAGAERTLSTITAVNYVVTHDIPGAIVECGVWRGGQMMAAAYTLKQLGEERQLILFDTFTGMTEPGKLDRDLHNNDATPVFVNYASLKKGDRWCESSIDDVKNNLMLTNYPMSLIDLVQGPVEETIPHYVPDSISYLRLDTDWYASTQHEFEHLYPVVSRLGVVTIDDYGHWQGARQATDEYLAANQIPALLQRIDYSARQFIKP